MMITLGEYKNSLSFSIVGQNKKFSFPIFTKHANWTPLFMFYAGSIYSDCYTDSTIEIFKMNENLFE